jgi:electron transfer flavoprotein beta subunit
MKILVCISVVPDTTTKITFTDNDTQFNKNGVQYIVNPYDELAVTRALEIAEANNGTVTIVHVGEADSEPSIRKALSMGAHEAIRINAIPVDAQFVAEEIAKIATGYDLILTGRESIDYNGGAVCGLLGAMLNIPSINVVTRIDYDGAAFTFDRDIDGGRETVTCSGPLVASAQKDLCEPRIPNMRGIMAARTKPLQIIEASVSNQAVNYQSYSLPAAKSGVKLIDPSNAAELINILKNEVKVI